MDPRPRKLAYRFGRLARGFSQLERLMTITPAGIMSAGAIHQTLPQAGKSSAARQALRMADDLRHTRLLAMGWGKPLIFSAGSHSWRVSCFDLWACTNASSAASRCPDPTPVVVDPGHHGPFCVALENGVTLSRPDVIQFDLLGKPQSASAITYQLSANDAAIATVSVAADTGFVTTMVLR